MASLSEALSLNFYLWERRGRGWDVWDFPVALEPPFAPFYFHFVPSYETTTPVDDGRKPTLLSELAEGFKRLLQGSTEQRETLLLPESTESPLPVPFESATPTKEIRVTIPPDIRVPAEFAELLLLNLGNFRQPLSYEVIGTGNAVSIVIACGEPDVPSVVQQLRSHFPEATYAVGGNTLSSLLDSGRPTVVVDFGLSEEFMRPIRSFSSFDPDPLIGIFGALENLADGETSILQVLFKSVENPWAESMIRSVTGNDGGSFFLDSPDMLALTREKVGAPLFAVALRVVAQGTTEERAWDIARSIGNSLLILASPASNELIPLANNDYPDALHIEDVVNRQTHRSGMILNSRELLNLVHLPSVSVRSQRFRGFAKKTKTAPKSLAGNEYILGENAHQNQVAQVSLSVEQRLRHVHVVGSTGTGKSTLLLNLITQDMKRGRGCAVFDPHGDLIDRVTELVPDERVNDVVLFDPADTEFPVSFNILGGRTEVEKTVLSSDLVALFRRFSTSWGDQMTAVLGNAVSAFLESAEGGTLLELRRFLLEDAYRNNYLKGVRDSDIVYFWEKQFPLLKGHALGSILTRLDIFLRPKTIRRIVGQKSGLDCSEMINSGKILLVKLAQGLIGEENAHLLGSLLVVKLYQAMMARQTKEVKDREPFYLYIDEFQHFITPSMASVLESGRKFGVGLIVSHQQMRQLVDVDDKLASSLITNPITRICFRLGDFDAERLAGGFSSFNAADLENLGVGEAITRVERSDQDFNLKTFGAPIVPAELASKKREKIVALTRERYGRRIEDKGISLPIETRDIPRTTIEVKQVSALAESEQAAMPRPAEMPFPPATEEKKSISQHRYLQTLVKKMAEQRGYKAVVEEPTPDGGGRVDVGLEREGEKIAVEISVTTEQAWEHHNVEKCLKAGYQLVIVCSSEKKNLEKMRTSIRERLSSDVIEKVRFLEPEELFMFLDGEVAKRPVEEKRVKGYRVKVEYQTLSESDRARKQEAVAQVIVQALRRLKREE